MSTTNSTMDVTVPGFTLRTVWETFETITDLIVGTVVLAAISVFGGAAVHALGLSPSLPALRVPTLGFFLGAGTIIWASIVIYGQAYWTEDDQEPPPWEDASGLDYYAIKGFIVLVLAIYKTLVIGIGAVLATWGIGTPVQALAIALLVAVPLGELYAAARGHSFLWPVAVTLGLATLPAVFVGALSAYTTQRTGDAMRRALGLLSELMTDLAKPPATGGIVDLLRGRGFQ